MDALSLSGAEASARSIAVTRLQAVANDMTWLAQRLRSQRDPSIARGPLALSARAGWGLAQAALIQADAGIVSRRMIDGIQSDRGVDAPGLRRLALSTLEATERRLQRLRPHPCEPVQREASR